MKNELNVICTCVWPYIDLSMFLNCENIILGVTNTIQKALINHLFIILKMYIFAQHCKNRDPNVIGAIKVIKYVHVVEEGVAVKKSSNIVNALQKHRMKLEFLNALMA